MKSFVQKIGYSAIYVYVEFFLGLVASILIARSLGPDNFGLYSYLIKVAAILMVVINGGISTGVLRFLAEYTSENNSSVLAHKVYAYFAKLQLIKCFLIVVITYFIIQDWLGLIIEPHYDTLFLVILVAVLFKSYYMFQVGAIKGLERFDKLAKIVLVVCPVYLLLVILASSYELSVEYFVYIYLITSFLFWVMSYSSLKPLLKKGECELDNEFKTRAANYVKVVTVNTVLASFVIGYVEVFFLKNMSSIENVGFFNIGLMISKAAIGLVPGVYNSILMPRIVKQVTHSNSDNEKSGEFLFSTIRHMFFLTLLVAVPAAYYASELNYLLFGELYEGAANVLLIMLIASVSTAIIHPATAYFVSKDRQSDMLKINIVVLGLSIGWAYLLVSEYGLMGAVISFSLTSLVSALCLFCLLFYSFEKLSSMREIALMIVVSVVSIAVVSMIPVFANGVIELIIGSFVYALVFSAGCWLLNVVSPVEKQAIMKLLGK